MLGFIFAFASALGETAYGLLNKQILGKVGRYGLTAFTFLTAAVLSLCISLAIGLPLLKPGFWEAALLEAALEIVGAYFYFKAIEAGEISLSMPMMAFTPVFLLIFAPLLLNEAVSALGILGILLIAAGAYLLGFDYVKRGLLEPIKSIFRQKNTRYMLFAAFVYACMAMAFKVAVSKSDAFFSVCVITSVVGACFLIIAARRNEIKPALGNLRGIIFSGIANTAAFALMGISYVFMVVPYANAIKRLSIIFTVAGGGIILKEKELKHRLFAAGLMVAGVIIIVLG